MALLESANLTYDQLQAKAKTHKCLCGGNLSVAWSAKDNCYILRCGNSLNHSEFIRPYKPSVYDIPGFNLPGVIRRKEKQMVQQYGIEKVKTAVKIAGGNIIATLTQKGAADMLSLFYPEAAKTESGRAAIIQAAVYCRDYGLSPIPAAGHIFILPFKNTKTGQVDYVVVTGIKGNRLVCGRDREYGYADYTPRIMTDEEQIKIYGETDKLCIVTITKLIIPSGLIYPGYGKWTKTKEVYGGDKGNTPFNMSCIHSERQALNKLNPGAMPADVELVDERFIEVPKVSVDQAKIQEIINKESPQLTEQKAEEKAAPGPTPAPAPAPGTPARKYKTDPRSIKNLGEFFQALIRDYPEKFADRDDILHFRKKSVQELGDLGEEYIWIAEKVADMAANGNQDTWLYE